jgi:hypothetical protein
LTCDKLRNFNNSNQNQKGGPGVNRTLDISETSPGSYPPLPHADLGGLHGLLGWLKRASPECHHRFLERKGFANLHSWHAVEGLAETGPMDRPEGRFVIKGLDLVIVAIAKGREDLATQQRATFVC